MKVYISSKQAEVILDALQMYTSNNESSEKNIETAKELVSIISDIKH